MKELCKDLVLSSWRWGMRWYGSGGCASSQAGKASGGGGRAGGGRRSRCRGGGRPHLRRQRCPGRGRRGGHRSCIRCGHRGGLRRHGRQ